jgi:hypothetical protein
MFVDAMRIHEQGKALRELTRMSQGQIEASCCATSWARV